jgi:hypothetical protein
MQEIKASGKADYVRFVRSWVASFFNYFAVILCEYLI